MKDIEELVKRRINEIAYEEEQKKELIKNNEKFTDREKNLLEIGYITALNDTIDKLKKAKRKIEIKDLLIYDLD